MSEMQSSANATSHSTADVQRLAYSLGGGLRVVAADRAHRLVGAGEAVELEAPAQPRQRVVDVLAQNDAAAVEFDAQLGALGQAQYIAHGLGQRDLPALGNKSRNPRQARTSPTAADTPDATLRR